MDAQHNKSNKELGLLGRLPREVRNQIYSCVLDAELRDVGKLDADGVKRFDSHRSYHSSPKATTIIRMSSPGPDRTRPPSRQLTYIAGDPYEKPLDRWDKLKGNIFNVKSYATDTFSPGKRLLRIGEVSAALCGEVTETFLSNSEFRFDFLDSWTTFLANVPRGNRCGLRYVFFDLHSLGDGESISDDWPKLRQMMKNLSHELGDLRIITFHCTGWGLDATMEVVRVLTQRLRDIESDTVISVACREGYYKDRNRREMELALERADHYRVWGVLLRYYDY